MPKVTIVIAKGSVVQDLRERKGLSRTQLGDLIQRSHESIRRIELGKPVGRVLVCQVANVLQVDADELIRPGDADADEAEADAA